MNVEGLNYLPKLLEALERDQRDIAGMSGLITRYKAAVPFVVTKAHLPLLWNTIAHGDALLNVRLPYDACVLEWQPGDSFHTKQQLADPDFDSASKRVILAEHVLIQDVPAINVTAAWYSDTLHKWAVGIAAAVIPEPLLGHVDDMYGTADIMLYSDPPDTDPTKWNAPVLTPAHSGMTIGQITSMYNALGLDVSHIANDIVDEIRMVLGFMAVLSCESISIGQTVPPAKLNKKRAKHNKIVIPSYKFINIKFTDDEPSRSYGEPQYHVKSHYRRGHVRRLHDSNRRVWVKPTVIHAEGAPAEPRYKV